MSIERSNQRLKKTTSRGALTVTFRSVLQLEWDCEGCGGALFAPSTIAIGVGTLFNDKAMSSAVLMTAYP